MRGRLRYILILLLVCELVCMCGCSGGRELHEKLIIQAIAVDSQDDSYRLTAQAYDFQNPKDEKEPGTRVIEVQGKTLFDALEGIKHKTSLEPIYSQNMIILIGENVAKSGVNNFIDFFIRHCETRPKVKIGVCRGTAADLLKVRKENNVIKAQNIHDLIPDELNSDVMNFMGSVCGGISDPYAAWVDLDNRENPQEIIFKGIGIFDKDVLIDYLSEDDAFGFMIFKGIGGFGSCVVNDEKFGEVTCSVSSASTKIKSELRENLYPIFKINVVINMEAFSFDNKSEDIDLDSTEIPEKRLEEKLRQILQSSLSKVLNMKSDALGFGKVLRNEHAEYFKEVEETWKMFMPKCSYEISQKVSLNITGKEPI